MDGEKRAGSRRRVRFRSGKLASLDGAFLGDCQIYDRSADGARLRIGTSGPIPESVLLFDDEQNSLAPASVAWRRPNELGIRFIPGRQTAKTEEIARRLAGKYYAL
jgi:hypothetical protein